jgi:hypothetical protein
VVTKLKAAVQQHTHTHTHTSGSSSSTKTYISKHCIAAIVTNVHQPHCTSYNTIMIHTADSRKWCSRFAVVLLVLFDVASVVCIVC